MRNTVSPKKTKKARKFRKLIFIDRDGVINYDNLSGYITEWKDFRFIQSSLTALQSLTKAGYQIIIISNQAGVGDGIYSKKALALITRKMLAELRRAGIKISAVYYCLHGKRAGCGCRKPKTGLFRMAARDFRFDRPRTYFVGDKASDVVAGKRFGLKTAFVMTGHGRVHAKKLSARTRPDLIGQNLHDVSKRILAQ